MKKQLNIFLILIFFFTISCRKDNGSSDPHSAQSASSGEATAGTTASGSITVNTNSSQSASNENIANIEQSTPVVQLTDDQKNIDNLLLITEDDVKKLSPDEAKMDLIKLYDYILTINKLEISNQLEKIKSVFNSIHKLNDKEFKISELEKSNIVKSKDHINKDLNSILSTKICDNEQCPTFQEIIDNTLAKLESLQEPAAPQEMKQPEVIVTTTVPQTTQEQLTPLVEAQPIPVEQVKVENIPEPTPILERVVSYISTSIVAAYEQVKEYLKSDLEKAQDKFAAIKANYEAKAKLIDQQNPLNFNDVIDYLNQSNALLNEIQTLENAFDLVTLINTFIKDELISKGNEFLTADIPNKFNTLDLSVESYLIINDEVTTFSDETEKFYTAILEKINDIAFADAERLKSVEEMRIAQELAAEKLLAVNKAAADAKAQAEAKAIADAKAAAEAKLIADKALADAMAAIELQAKAQAKAAADTKAAALAKATADAAAQTIANQQAAESAAALVEQQAAVKTETLNAVVAIAEYGNLASTVVVNEAILDLKQAENTAQIQQNATDYLASTAIAMDIAAQSLGAKAQQVPEEKPQPVIPEPIAPQVPETPNYIDQLRSGVTSLFTGQDSKLIEQSNNFIALTSEINKLNLTTTTTTTTINETFANNVVQQLQNAYFILNKTIAIATSEQNQVLQYQLIDKLFTTIDSLNTAGSQFTEKFSSSPLQLSTSNTYILKRFDAVQIPIVNAIPNALKYIEIMSATQSPYPEPKSLFTKLNDLMDAADKTIQELKDKAAAVTLTAAKQAAADAAIKQKAAEDLAAAQKIATDTAAAQKAAADLAAAQKAAADAAAAAAKAAAVALAAQQAAAAQAAADLAAAQKAAADAQAQKIAAQLNDAAAQLLAALNKTITNIPVCAKSQDLDVQSILGTLSFKDLKINYSSYLATKTYKPNWLETRNEFYYSSIPLLGFNTFPTTQPVNLGTNSSSYIYQYYYVPSKKCEIGQEKYSQHVLSSVNLLNYPGYQTYKTLWASFFDWIFGTNSDVIKTINVQKVKYDKNSVNDKLNSQSVLDTFETQKTSDGTPSKPLIFSP